MVRNEFTFPSADGRTGIHAVEWTPDMAPRAVLVLSHGVSEHILRYEPLAAYLTERGFAVAGHDHLGHGLSVAAGAPRLYFGPRGSWDWAPPRTGDASCPRPPGMRISASRRDATTTAPTA